MRILLGLILSLMISGQSWATLTATYIPVTKTGGSTPALQNSTCTDTGGNFTCTDILNVPQICLNGVCEVAWPSGGSQTTGSSMLAGNGSGGYTNVTVTSPSTYSGGVFTAAVSNNVNLNGNQLGAWSSKSDTTVYQASTDLFVIYTGNNGTFNLISDSSATPSTTRGTCNNGIQCAVSIVVRKNDYWEATKSGGSATTVSLFQIPIGS